MASLKQIEANRLNAQKSTGPRSVEGKAASSQNALKSGIDAQATFIRGESPSELRALTDEYLERFAPQTPEERTYVDILIRSEWKLRRMDRVEAELWEHEMNRGDFDSESPLGSAWDCADTRFSRLQRRVDSLTRGYKDALRELERLRARRTAAPQSSQATDSSVDTPKIGFVPQNAPSAVANNPLVDVKAVDDLCADIPPQPSSRKTQDDGSVVVDGRFRPKAAL